MVENATAKIVRKLSRVWLREKYQTLDELNKAWNTEFWGHTIYDWDEVVLPDALGDGLKMRQNRI